MFFPCLIAVTVTNAHRFSPASRSVAKPAACDDDNAGGAGGGGGAGEAYAPGRVHLAEQHGAEVPSGHDGGVALRGGTCGRKFGEFLAFCLLLGVLRVRVFVSLFFVCLLLGCLLFFFFLSV